MEKIHGTIKIQLNAKDKMKKIHDRIIKELSEKLELMSENVSNDEFKNGIKTGFELAFNQINYIFECIKNETKLENYIYFEKTYSISLILNENSGAYAGSYEDTNFRVQPSDNFEEYFVTINNDECQTDRHLIKIATGSKQHCFDEIREYIMCYL